MSRTIKTNDFFCYYDIKRANYFFRSGQFLRFLFIISLFLFPVYALCKLCKVEGDFSEIARQGSGSACRSIYGGFVQWHMGAAESGEDSIASVVKEAEHWSDLRILILVVSLQKDILVYFFY